ncbi:hypothetical protein P7C70_g3895, partial [Phenoliferia sp. Uapishka_3]
MPPAPLGKSALVVGGNRGFGLALVKELASRGITVYATIRKDAAPTDGTFPSGVKVVTGVDLASEGGGADALEKGLEGAKLDLVIISAGVLHADSLQTLNWKDHLSMYAICAIAPAFLSARLSKIKAFNLKSRLLLLTSEGGSIALRTKEEGGGMYGHHGSKAAGASRCLECDLPEADDLLACFTANMQGRLLHLDLSKEGVIVMDIHPGFMKTEMTKNVGFDQYYESGGAVEPAFAAKEVLNFAATTTPEHGGRFFAPLGPRDVGQAENVMGKNLPTPLELPW